MNDQWFYIQQWKRKRWSYLNVEMSLQEAKSLWSSLIESMGTATDVKPLAIVTKEDLYKVVLELEDGWEIVVCNAMFLNDGKEEPLLVQRSGNEKI